MIYVFGDSTSYGVKIEEKIREKSVWGFYLSELLKTKYVNYSAPGGSNWRTARLINYFNFGENDLVVISWTQSNRMEIGINTTYPIITNKELEYLSDDCEDNGEVLTKRIYNNLDTKSKDKKFKIFNKLIYNEFYNIQWFEEMFKIMFFSCIKKLEICKCKFLMFNAFDIPYTKSDDCFNIKNYVLGYHNNMQNFIGKKIYWSPDEHKIVANTLYEQYNEIYK